MGTPSTWSVLPSGRKRETPPLGGALSIAARRAASVGAWTVPGARGGKGGEGGRDGGMGGGALGEQPSVDAEGDSLVDVD